MREMGVENRREERRVIVKRLGGKDLRRGGDEVKFEVMRVRVIGDKVDLRGRRGERLVERLVGVGGEDE